MAILSHGAQAFLFGGRPVFIDWFSLTDIKKNTILFDM